jgi:hypothetical protein
LFSLRSRLIGLVVFALVLAFSVIVIGQRLTSYKDEVIHSVAVQRATEYLRADARGWKALDGASPVVAQRKKGGYTVTWEPPRDTVSGTPVVIMNRGLELVRIVQGQ